jgi:hypothetical protein
MEYANSIQEIQGKIQELKADLKNLQSQGADQYATIELVQQTIEDMQNKIDGKNYLSKMCILSQL